MPCAAHPNASQLWEVLQSGQVSSELPAHKGNRLFLCASICFTQKALILKRPCVTKRGHPRIKSDGRRSGTRRRGAAWTRRTAPWGRRCTLRGPAAAAPSCQAAAKGGPWRRAPGLMDTPTDRGHTHTGTKKGLWDLSFLAQSGPYSCEVCMPKSYSRSRLPPARLTPRAPLYITSTVETTAPVSTRYSALTHTRHHSRSTRTRE